MKDEVVLKIIQKHGFCNKDNTSKYIGLIRDNFSAWKLEKNLLIFSLKADIPQEIIFELKSNSTGDAFSCKSNDRLLGFKNKLIEKLENKFWLTKKASEWIVHTWVKVILDSIQAKKNLTFIPLVTTSIIENKSISKQIELDLSRTSGQVEKSLTNIESSINKIIIGKSPLEKFHEISAKKDFYTVPKITGPIKPKTARIPAGKFLMGSQKSEFGRCDDETLHHVTITKDFLFSIHPITQEIWRSVMTNDSDNIEEPNLPVTNVSWDDCQDFIKTLNTLTGEIYRLPTEAEWEYACRAGSVTAYSFGKNINESNANYKSEPFPILKPVCSYLPNAFGLYDMHGNIWEWCQDWYGKYITAFQWLTNFSRKPLHDPTGPMKGEKKVIRGGSFNSIPKYLRSAIRSKVSPSTRHNSVGFRLIKEI